MEAPPTWWWWWWESYPQCIKDERRNKPQHSALLERHNAVPMVIYHPDFNINSHFSHRRKWTETETETETVTETETLLV